MLDRRRSMAMLALRCTAIACVAVGASGAGAREPALKVPSYDKPRPGLYGRIEVRGAPPPVIYAEPVVARPSIDRAGPPVYLYVPPGQVRRWAQHCNQWNACEQPVYFVRVDHSPSRLGGWKKTQRPQPADSPVLQVLNRFTS
ncbi:hypothetical protein ACPWT1_11440 [Ramlibacter sp. MMS24-I3-19]|uniref:hypothetical protein n=1 Tax=Ramlibacter sp. MMS24-I3-19 TaxID=3416606 RepID=UPI003CFEF761